MKRSFSVGGKRAWCGPFLAARQGAIEGRLARSLDRLKSPSGLLSHLTEQRGTALRCSTTFRPKSEAVTAPVTVQRLHRNAGVTAQPSAATPFQPVRSRQAIVSLMNGPTALMRENGLLAPHRVLRTEAKPHDGTIVTDKVNEMWGTDMTQTITIREGRANVFVAVEHANSEVVGIHASRSANRFPWSRCARVCIGASEPSRPGWRVD